MKVRVSFTDGVFFIALAVLVISFIAGNVIVAVGAGAFLVAVFALAAYRVLTRGRRSATSAAARNQAGPAEQ